MRMFVRSFAVAALLLASLVACNSDALPPAGQHASVSGVVTDKATNAPIEGARIVVDAILVATTDKDGKFALDNIPPGDFDFTIEAPGYTTLTGSAKTEADKPFALNLSLEKTPAP